MEVDMDKCFLLLNQTFALADFLSLNIVLGIETETNRRCWSSNGTNFQCDLISNELYFRDNDVWLTSGKVFGQQVLEKDKLIDLTANGSTRKDTRANGDNLIILPDPEAGFDQEIFIEKEDKKVEFLELDERQEFASDADFFFHNRKINPDMTISNSSSVTVTVGNHAPPEVPKKRRYEESSHEIRRHELAGEGGDVFLFPNDDELTNLPSKRSTKQLCQQPHISSQYDLSELTYDGDKEELKANIKKIRSPTEMYVGDHCHICKMAFASNDEGITHHNEVHHQCVECAKRFKGLRSLMIHIGNTHRKLKLYRCPICDGRFGHSFEMSKHVKRFHNQSLRDMAPKPVREMAPKPVRETKPKTSTKPKSKVASNRDVFCRSKLSECDEVFVTHDEELAHYKNAHCYCRECGMTCKNERNLKKHVDCVHKRLLSCECKVCGEKFRHNMSMYAHMIKEHQYTAKQRKKTSTAVPSCRSCALKFYSEEERMEHLKAFHTKCEICGLAFRSVKALKMHILGVHEKRKPVKCPKCDHRCSQKSNLTVHDFLVHQQKKDVICTYCGKAFSMKGSLNAHIKNCHTKDRKYACTLCPKKFVAPCRLRSHVKTAHRSRNKIEHSGRPHECEDCQQTFALSSQLQQHIHLKHSRKYFCQPCKIVFASGEALKRHEARHQQGDL